jgi:hypothetical protein
VGHHDHRAPLVGERPDDPHHLLLELGVEGGGRFVEQERARLHAERPGDGGALLLAARKLRRVGVALFVDADLVEILPRAVLDLLGVAAEHGDRRLHDVLENRHVGPEVELLEHHRQVGPDPRDLRAVGGLPRDSLALPAHRFVLEKDLSLLAVLEEVRTAQERRLPRPGRSDERHHLALAGDHIDTLQDLERAEALVKVSNLDDGWRISRQGNQTLFFLSEKQDANSRRMQRIIRE